MKIKMKDTNTVRTVNNVGMIMFPKEIRKNFDIKAGDRFKFLICDNGDIVIRKEGTTI